MPRFYFNIRNDIVADDDEGVDLADLAAAREVALKSVRGLAAENVGQGHLNLNHRIEIVDERGQHLLTVAFRDAVTVEG